MSAYENSSKYPSIELLIKIATLFSVSADHLLGLPDRMELNAALLTDEQASLIHTLINQFSYLNNNSRHQFYCFLSLVYDIIKTNLEEKIAKIEINSCNSCTNMVY